MAQRQRWISKFTVKEGSWVFVPAEKTAEIGLAIKKDLQERWKTPSFYYHLNRGGHVAALQSHMHHKCFLHMDIRDFFGHVNRSRITRSIKSYFSYSSAREIAIESTVRMPKSGSEQFMLPFGFVQSPILASVCLSKSALGRRLRELHKHPDFTVSVYMDDIIISADRLTLLGDVLQSVTDAADKAGFPLNSEKQEGPGSGVTSFNVTLRHGDLRITDDRMDKFAAAYTASTNKHQREGILGYVNSVNPEQAKILSGMTVLGAE